MSDPVPSPGPFRTAEISQTGTTRFAVVPDASACAMLAETLGILRVRKLRFDGEIRPAGRHGFHLTGSLGATVVQPCVATLDPVTTRIDTEVTRTYLPAGLVDDPAPGSEVEMPEDETVEPMGDTIDPSAVMTEALALSLPEYPRAGDVALGPVEARPEGAAPIREVETKPFAGLAGLRDRLSGAETDPDDDSGGSGHDGR